LAAGQVWSRLQIKKKRPWALETPGSNPGDPTFIWVHNSWPLSTFRRIICQRMFTLSRSKYRELLDDPNFRRWYENVARGSLATAQEWFRRMGLVRDRFGVAPERIAKMGQREASDFLLDVVGALDREGKSGNYIANIVRPLKSWLSWNGVEISRRIKIPRSETTEVENEKPPTPEELKQILNAADPRARTSCALMAFGGCRVEVLGSYGGDDGLEMRDLPELKVTRDKVEFDAVPTKVVVRKTLNKARHNYFTFLGEEGCRYLKEYLEWRLRRGERLLPETPVISVHEQRGRTVMPDQVGKKHIASVNIGDQIRKPIRSAGFGWRPYVLRRYFDVRMMMGESDGFVIRDWRQFFMGHKGDIEATYTVNKGMTQDTVDKMREGYARAFEKYLTTSREKKEVSRDEVLATIRKEMLLGRYGDEEIEQLGDLSRLTTEQFVEVLNRKSLGLNGKGSQKVVPAGEVRGLVEQGWEYVSQLPDGYTIVRLPRNGLGS
jgi:hypothetical protein